MSQESFSLNLEEMMGPSVLQMAKMLGVDPKQKLESLKSLQRSYDLAYKLKELVRPHQDIFDGATAVEAVMAYVHLAVWAASCAELGEEQTSHMMRHTAGVMYPVFELMLKHEGKEDGKK